MYWGEAKDSAMERFPNRFEEKKDASRMTVMNKLEIKIVWFYVGILKTLFFGTPVPTPRTSFPYTTTKEGIPKKAILTHQSPCHLLAEIIEK